MKCYHCGTENTAEEISKMESANQHIDTGWRKGSCFKCNKSLEKPKSIKPRPYSIFDWLALIGGAIALFYMWRFFGNLTLFPDF